jgi:hypothetical protein
VDKCISSVQGGTSRIIECYNNEVKQGDKEEESPVSEWKDNVNLKDLSKLESGNSFKASKSFTSMHSRHSRARSVADSVYSNDDEFFDAHEHPSGEDTNSASETSHATMEDAEEHFEEDDEEDDDDDGVFASQGSCLNTYTGDDTVQDAAPPYSGDGARRSALPSLAVESDISLVSILKKNVGKDLSAVSMPVVLNEPLNLLQKLCEELEYSELLDKASDCDDPHDRMIYVAAFAISAYASSAYRSSRKPFNPLLGETYECVRSDKGDRHAH